MSLCILIMRDTQYCIVGPFATEDERAAWADAHWNPDGDPRWQTIALANPSAAPAVLAPDSPAAIHAIKE